MPKKNNAIIKIMASVALWAIVVSIIGTGALLIFSSSTSAPSYDTISQQEAIDFIEQYSGSLDTEITSTWAEILIPEEIIEAEAIPVELETPEDQS